MESLLNFQVDLSSRILRSFSNFKKSPKDRLNCLSYVEARLESLEQLWLEFLGGHKELMRGNEPKQLNDTSYIKTLVYDTTEECFIDYKCSLKQALERFSSEPEKVSTARSPQVTLPKINIPQFSGKYSEWSTFRDLFHSLVHTNDSLDNVQKLHYLKGYLTEEADQLLRHIPIVDCNYMRCWNLLEERYNNKRYMCHQILQRLLGQKTISTESARGLKGLIDTTNDCLHALTNIGIDVKSWDVLIIHILTAKLDPDSRRQWEFNVNNNSRSFDSLPTFKQFEEFLTNRYRAIEFLEPGSNPKRDQTYREPLKRALYTTNVQCPFCSEEHRLGSCQRFIKETVEARRNFVESNNLCYLCLGKNHSARVCYFKGRCHVCKRKHNSLLHPTGKEIVESTDETDTSKEVGESSSDSIVSCFSTGMVYNHDLLATALVTAKSKRGCYTIRALLDQGSQASFVTEAVVQLLGLSKIPVAGQISGLAEQESTCRAMVILDIQSRVDPNFTIQVKAYVLKSITALLPSCNIEAVKWPEIRELMLADPGYDTPGKIDLLLGAGVYGKILQPGVKKGPIGTPIAQATSLGWVLSGEIRGSTIPRRSVKTMHCRIDDNELLKKFWELEAEVEMPKEKMLKDHERRCEEIFETTTQRDCDGRFVVRLPLKADVPEVSNSLLVAEKRFYALERRLCADQALKESYSEVMKEYLLLNHMELVPSSEKGDPRAIYLPHHAIIREDKDTTKLRVVFDASCKGSNDKSLNDNLLIGPTLQPDLRHLVMRWRKSPICLTADIAKMYRQVKVNELDVNYQRILWREDLKQEIQHYRLMRVTFGTASAPYLAVKALQQLAIDEINRVNPALSNCKESSHSYCRRVLTDFYMDDLLTGCETVEDGIKVYDELNALLKKGGFDLLKWTSNSQELMEEIKAKGTDSKGEEAKEWKIKTDEIIKIVGLTWTRSDDSFRYAVKIPPLQSPVTKRKIISDISRLYDPLGWLGPSVICAKIIIQKLWIAGIDWDSQVPNNILSEWLTYRDELTNLIKVRIPRWLQTKADDLHIELHGFCDASKAAYAAVVYVRVIDSDGKVHVRLVSAKTKVAPVKQVSIPRLELCGAVLLTRLMLEIGKVMNINTTNIHAWTDSTVVLAWLNSHPSRWKVFVANRVSEILTSFDSQNWSHVPSKENPADGASRGLLPSDLVNHTIWFNGPEFLTKECIVYQKPRDVATELEAVKCHCATVEPTIWERFSSLTRMMRVIAYCQRFVNNIKSKHGDKDKKYLTTEEIEETLKIVIKFYQAEHFKAEIEIIKRKENLPRRSSIRSLNPMLDENQILRVGGRLEHSQLTEEVKHPILLPKRCHLTDLLISNAHKQTLHGGPQLMLNYIQAKYFIIGAKQLVRSHYRKCITCVKQAAPTQTQLMGQLPSPRVTPTRAFKCSGVDYAGPIQIRTSKGRGHHSQKGYICLFVCMVTRAVHIEAVTDYTSHGFMQAFKRFIARRGTCTDLWSDNAKNFVGAATELKRLFLVEKRCILEEVAETLATNGCNWHFIPARSPNFGGLWEAGIKSVKYHLKRVIGESTLTFEELSTVLSQIEACLNSRPQSVINNNADEVTVLTPGHFLIGEPIIIAPDRNFEASNVGSLRRWQYTQKMLQDFWRRWSQEYLTKFYHRYRWSTQNPQPRIGDVVVVKEDGLPPCKWLLGRVVETHPGLDNLVRVVTLKVKNGTLKRPVSKLCLLPISLE